MGNYYFKNVLRRKPIVYYKHLFCQLSIQLILKFFQQLSGRGINSRVPQKLQNTILFLKQNHCRNNFQKKEINLEIRLFSQCENEIGVVRSSNMNLIMK